MKIDLSDYGRNSGKITAVLLALVGLFWYAVTGGFSLVAKLLYTVAVALAAPLLANDVKALINWIK